MFGIRRGRRRARSAAPTQPWSRERLLVMLIGSALAVVLLLTGLVMAIVYSLADRAAAPAVVAQEGQVESSLPIRDRIAAAPMASLDPDAAFTPDPAVTEAAPIKVPMPPVVGPAEVPSGFPHTPQGAVGQLAAIEQMVLESMSLPVTNTVHSAWAQPGGPSLEEWELTRNVQTFLASARQGGQEKDFTTLITANPAAGLVKGTDGPDWAVVCVLMDVQAAIKTESRMGYGLCSRMQWIDGRWQIAAGAAPAKAPSAWPGSRAAADAGWLTWTDEVE
jgi:hypothetical protein